MSPSTPPVQVTCRRRVRPRPPGTGSGCTTRARAAAVVLLCGILSGSSSHARAASPAAFLSAAAGNDRKSGRVPLAPPPRPAAICECAPMSSTNHRNFGSSSRSSSRRNSNRKGSGLDPSSPRDAVARELPAPRGRKEDFQRRLHRRSGNRVAPLQMSSDINNDNNRAVRSSRENPSPRPPQHAAAAVDLTVTASALDSPKTAVTSAAAASRSDFLRQTSAVAALVGAASSGLLLPTRPASALGVGSRTPKAEAAGVVGAAERMVWLNEDSGTVSARLSQADETYGQGFVAYLARFLLNYDEGCREYFKGKLDCALPKRDGSQIWDEFRGFVASVGLGLNRFQGPNGTRELCESLSRKYASGGRDGAPQQIAVLFSLLPPEVQPVRSVKSLLSFPTGAASGFREVKPSFGDGELDLESIFGESPSALLPKELRPRYDEAVGSFFVPGVPRRDGRSDIEAAFGSRGPFPISKERSLKAVDFALFAACGAFGCTTTHTTVIPLDVVKTRLQTDPGRYAGLAQGVTTIAEEEGWMMLMQGLGPTLAGYFWYGITVYPGYELFKRLFIELVGPLNAALFRVPLVLAAGASATFFACIGVCPAEAVRIRQVADPAVGGMPSAIRQIVAESGWGKLYEGLPSILFRQISFGMMKFLVFDFFTDFAYDLVPYLADQTATRLSVSLTSGLVAGVCAAIVSQPADTVLSTMNRSPERSTIPETIKSIVDERGPGGLFLGLPSRIVWSGAIISGQFLLYDVCKTALHVSADDLRVFLDAIASAGL